ncbi:MAG: zf-HC2 domain-containing protein [Chloroflexota bacterium]|nr:zf-HC2 domain-containing protein [Chloroflexota bacterium]
MLPDQSAHHGRDRRDLPAVDADEMTCQELVDLVTDYLEGALDPETRRRFDVHLADCPYCPAYVDQIRLTILAVGAARAEELAPDTCTALLTHFRAWSATR